MPPVVFSTRLHQPTARNPEGVLVYLRTADGNDALAWMDKDGNRVTESQLAILQAAECPPDTPSLPRLEKHHALVRDAVKMIAQEEKTVGGQLGRPSGARFRTFERLKRYADSVKGTLFESQELLRAIDEIYRYPLRQAAIDSQKFVLRAIAEKRGMVAYHCATPNGQRLPDYQVRRKIEHQVAKTAHEHLIVFTDADKTTQIWQ